MIRDFLEVATMLNKQFEELPVLYGSLGLGRVIRQDFNPDDVDVLISDDLVIGRWKDLKKAMKNTSFALRDVKEREFERDNVRIAFAPASDLEKLTSITVKSLKITEESDARFLELTPRQYMEVYKSSQNEQYRKKNGKAEKDKYKIKMIEEYFTGE